MAWRYLKMVSGGSSSTETNPQEINILAGATKCQVGGTIEASRAPMYSANTALIDGNLTTATYYAAGPNPTITVTMPAAHTDLTEIQIWHAWSHYQHTIYLSVDKVNWVQCPFLSWANTNKQQNFSIPAEPATSQNFTADGVLNITQYTHGAAQDYTYNPEGGQVVGTPVNWTNGQNVTISNGTLTKTSGGNAWNGAAKGQQYDGNTDVFFQVKMDGPKQIAFGFTETVEPDTANNQITYRFELLSNSTYSVICLGGGMASGNYSANDIFKIAIQNKVIKFYKNDVLVHTNSITVYWPAYIDGALYTQGDNFTASINGGLEVVTPQDFVQAATLNIGFTEEIEKIYTANGYEYNQWSLNFLDYYFYIDQIYTANGYNQETTTQNNFALTETAAQDYTANGYDFMGVDEQIIILDFAASQEYTPQGYNFETSTQENIFIDYLGAQAFTAEGYDVATMAQENILMVSIAAQVYTPRGYSFEALASQEIIGFTDTAAQEFRAHFEQAKQEVINLTIEATQSFTGQFNQEGLLNFELNIGAEQDYTAIGYSNETTVSETIETSIETTVLFARHYDQTATGWIDLVIAANVEFQANFEANAAQSIFIEDSATATAIFSDGLQFQENAQENFNLSDGAAQEFTAFGGFEFNQNSVNNFGLSDAATSIYELGETGKYTEYVTHYLYLQEDKQATYTRNWLEFETIAPETINGFTVEAVSDHLQVNIFEANAAENLDYFISPLQFYGKYLETTAQDNFGLSIIATNERTENYLTFEMQANDFFFLHYTDIAVHEIIYLQNQQNMFYDFLFWDYADQIYSHEYLEFNPQATEIIDLTINSAGQYTNANMLNGFATDHIGLTMAAAVEYVQTIINNLEGIATENIGLNMEAAAEYVQTTVYNFDHFVINNVNLFFSAISEHVEAHIFENEAANTIGLNMQSVSEYQNINPFVSKAVEPIDFEHYAIFEITTEPRNYQMGGQINIKLNIVNWVYFESDIYVQTYKIEITKPNTLWEPLEQDRAMVEANQRPRQGANVEDTIFGGQDEFKIDRRILNLTDIDEPNQITYASEIKKPNTLYTNNNKIERGLIDD